MCHASRGNCRANPSNYSRSTIPNYCPILDRQFLEQLRVFMTSTIRAKLNNADVFACSVCSLMENRAPPYRATNLIVSQGDVLYVSAHFRYS